MIFLNNRHFAIVLCNCTLQCWNMYTYYMTTTVGGHQGWSMTKIFVRRWRETQVSHGQRLTQACMHSVLRAKRSGPRIGIKALNTQRPTVHSSPGSAHGAQQTAHQPCPQHHSRGRYASNTTASRETASLARTANTCMLAACAGAPIQFL